MPFRENLNVLISSFSCSVHHADPWEASQPNRVGMMLECSSGESLARAAFMHHDDQGYDALMHYTVISIYDLHVHGDRTCYCHMPHRDFKSIRLVGGDKLVYFNTLTLY